MVGIRAYNVWQIQSSGAAKIGRHSCYYLFQHIKGADMKGKFVKGMLAGAVVAFPLGINFGKDVPLLTDPFAAKPDIADKVIERTNSLIEDTKGMIHAATEPSEEQYNNKKK